jgi:Right handed beta helix region
MFISGANNTVEFSTFSECSDTGLQLSNGAKNNLILNCDSFYNADSALENADGFAAKLDVGSGNKFVGCRAWNNLDDGWDGYLRGADNVNTAYENCWAFRNGYLKSGALGAGDGNGFKTGGSDDKLLKHNATYKNCVAAGNAQDGFDHNSNRGSIIILNASSYGNGNNINFSSSNIALSLTVKNSISFSSKANIVLNATSATITKNSWQNGESAISADFVSLDLNLLTAPRKSDGSLPDVNFMKLAPGSSLINSGVDVGLPFKGSAPDLGAFEAQ